MVPAPVPKPAANLHITTHSIEYNEGEQGWEVVRPHTSPGMFPEPPLFGFY